MKRLFLMVVLCLSAIPLWADYGLSNVVTREITRGNVPPSVAPQQLPARIPEQIPAKGPEPVAAPALKKAAFYPYTIHISSWQNSKEAASQYEKKYRKLDKTFLTKIDLGQAGIWYRIDHGAFASTREATLKMKELQGKNIIDQDAFIGSAAPYALEIGVYAGKEGALAQAQKLRNTGVIPYVLKEAGGVYRLLAGAYPDEKSAAPAREDLNALGLKTKITKR